MVVLFRLAAVVGIALLAATATADEAPEMLAPAAHADWQAIGRLNHAGYRSRRLCTATLIAPDLVVSAAHCVVRSGADPIPPGELRFVAGWLRGAHAGLGRAAAVSVPRAWLQAAREGRADIAHDIALVRLTEAMGGVAPLPAAAPDSGEIRVLGYRWDRPHALSDSGTCAHTPVAAGVHATACHATFGTSGAPVLQRHDGAWRMVGIVSAVGGGRTYFATWRRPADDALTRWSAP